MHKRIQEQQWEYFQIKMHLRRQQDKMLVKGVGINQYSQMVKPQAVNQKIKIKQTTYFKITQDLEKEKESNSI